MKKTIKRPIDHVSYVCEPREIIIEARRPRDSAYLKIELKVTDKIALIGKYNIGFIDDIEVIHEKIKIFCEAVRNFTDAEIQHHVVVERIVPALRAKRSLKEVRAKTGRLIWRR